ncbi:nucleobase:cation symporter-2 family protein [Streptomyces ochraceiscleroticus]|uniref:Nucleobase:cation symporter-2 family protein n=1 Tax=Streptomyces ochraceiscleroticus TaxID=47761 RepID=A0ABW1MSQ9_9ACTN|nr:nucleobase:cation symporter-2 family protein [Streptomyces ochraceiscleroticus]
MSSARVPSDASAPPAAGPAAVHPVDEVLPAGRMLVASLQHVASMYAGAVSVPLVVAVAAKMSAADTAVLMGGSLLMAGIATLLQTLGIGNFIGSRLPFVNGVSFAGVGVMLTILTTQGGVKAGMPVVFGAIIVSSLFGFLVSSYFSRLVRFFPPVVTGSVILLIGVSLIPVAYDWIVDGSSSGTPHPENIALAAATILVMLLLQRFTRGFLKQISMLFAMVFGTLLAIPMGLADFSKLDDAALVGIPSPLHFGAPQFSLPAIISMCVVMLVILTESTADMIALGKIVDKDVDEKTIARGLRADSLGSALSPLFNAFHASAFAQNIGLVVISNVRSRFVVALSGGLLVLIGLSPAAAALISVVPMPVLAAVSLFLFGSIAVSGIQTLLQADLHRGDNALIVVVTLGAGLAPALSDGFYDAFPSWAQIVLGSGISTGCLLAVTLNLVFNHLGKRARTTAEEPAAVH